MPRKRVLSILLPFVVALAILPASWSSGAASDSGMSARLGPLAVLQENDTNETSREALAPSEESSPASQDQVIIGSTGIDSRAVSIALGAGALAALFIYLFWLVVKPRGHERVIEQHPPE